ncbi:GH36-type glycosyl hydrolase domain-containing protein [Hydrogenophaga sp. OTU3427]|uniref:GH36-type glycosyl hydrolase domain-containing protein n=1 Tax=Hydrogenophaga sp. OTU3427 TaxID=3043856 RepID=UPI00313EA0DB
MWGQPIDRLHRIATWVPTDLIRVLDTRRGEALPPIRSELFGASRFEQHGHSLAATHQARKLSLAQGTFYPRLQNNMRTLRTAHGYLVREALAGHEIGPAAEWLLDNFHLIEDQWREVREGLPARYYRALPVLQDAPLLGLPRIYGVAWAFVAHTDSAFDATLLLHFLNAYQSVRELSQGELWALPTTLRVVLIENLRRLADRIASHKAARELAALSASRLDRLTVASVLAMRQLMTQRGVGQVFVVQLMLQLGTHGSAEPTSTLTQLRHWLASEVPDPGALQAQQHIDQVADHLSMGNAVTALRLIGAADWPDLVSQTSRVMRVMLASPVFAAEDEATRNKTLHAIERLSAASRQAESEVAQALLDAMSRTGGPSALASHWLVGPGRPALERQLGVRHLWPQAWRDQARITRAQAYFGTLLLGTLLLVWQLTAHATVPTGGWGQRMALALALLLMWLPASEAVVALVNRLISEATPPAHLSRLRLVDGIPPSAQTLVVVPALLSHPRAIDALAHRLLQHHLANTEVHAQFALLSDWCDADSAHQPGDDALLAHAAQALQALNTSHPTAPGQPPRFLLLHRPRCHSATQDRWMGWERKRGKLEQLVAALATGTPGPFFDFGPLSRMATGTCYLLTLDSDTELPPGRLRVLVGVAEHPQNRPQLAPDGRRVLQGYGILQPRVVAPLPTHGRPTPWQWLFAGQQGLDPYSAMSSDVYQDVFDEGSFTGKGLLHVATLQAVLGGRLPVEQVLSHDLLEGALVRCAVVSDVTLIEADPSHADAAASRLHRWTRGDWQLLSFVLHDPRWALGAINRWKLFDNLRRSLVAPACLGLIVLAMAGQGLSLAAALTLTLAAYAGGPLIGALAAGIPAHWSLVNSRFVHATAMDLLRTGAAALWHLALLPQQALLALDAVLRTLHRLRVSRRQLLAWTTADAAQAALGQGLGATLWRHRFGPLLALLLLGGLGLLRPPPGTLALALLALWAAAPWLVWLSNRPWAWWQRRGLPPADAAFLQGVARDTWRLFERCVDAGNHHLPPDNLQTAPLEVVAHRTSPTNIGLYLLSTACARQQGWIGTQELLERLQATLDTLGQMERHRGHFLNWYDTQTLLPLLPRYVSTVDSGNLSAHLLAVAQACRALAARPHDPAAATRARRGSLARLQAHRALWLSLLPERPMPGVLHTLLQADPAEAGDTGAWDTWLDDAALALEGLFPAPGPAALAHPPTEREQLHALLADHLALLRSAGRDHHASGPAGDALAGGRLRSVAKALEQLAWASDFRFLYHPQRHLLHIGYRVEEQQLDTSFYDLLASESHLTSLLAIAKGDLPVRHWTALGRPFFASGRHAVLRSWSGSMFEYLMPTLVMAPPEGSALQTAGASALREQIAYARAHALPWGVSECAYAGRDHTLAYQYAPQGVPRLALRRTPPAEHVVAPYATALAAMVDARAACHNLRTLAALAARGRYGFIEALDFSPSRQTQGTRHTPVCTYMAHHQGMTIVALTNVLLDGVVQRWGAAHPRIEAMGPLLHERAPRELPAPPPLPRLPLKALQHRAPEPVRLLVPGAQALEPTQLMSNGHYSVTLRPNGAGWSRLGQTGIGRWRDDALRDARGSFIYLRRGRRGVPVSLTSHPAPDAQAVYQCRLGVDRVGFTATWPDLRAHTTVWVSPEDDIELRKVVLTNLGPHGMELELISALDITLTSHEADEAHPAFSSLFVKAEWHSDQDALRLTRTPRLPTERALSAAHFVAEAQGEVLGLVSQTDRQRWLGRHRPPSHPLGQLEPVPVTSGALATGLDPVAVLGVVLRLAPGAQACVTFGTAASVDEATLSAVVDKYRQPSHVERASTMSATLAGIQASTTQIHPEYLPAQQALTTALVLTLPQVDGARGQGPTTPLWVDRRLLWPLGLSGDRPLLLLHTGPAQGLPLLRLMALLLRAWSRAGVACDLVVLSRETHSYHMPLQQACTQMSEQHQADIAQRPGPPVTGLHVLHHDSLSAGQIDTLNALARVQLHADGRPLMHQVRAWCERHQTPMARPWRGSPPAPVPVYLHSERATVAEGQFDGRSGAFGFEVGRGQRTMRPWINVLANPGFGCIVTESGGGNTWAGNSRLNQLTAWANDPVADPPAEWWLLQDRRSGETWGLTPSAWGDDHNPSRVEHAQGVTRITHRRGPVSTTLSWCVDPDTAVKQLRVQLHNHGSHKAHLRLVGMVEWQLGEKRRDRATLLTTACHAPPPDDGLWALLCTQTDRAGGFGGGTAFFCEGQGGPVGQERRSEGQDWTTDRAAFFDARGRLVLPRRLGRRDGAGLDPCAAISRLITLRPGARAEQVFLLGYADSADAARALARQATARPATEREHASLVRWDALLGATQVHTPDPLFNVLVNRWLLYQTVSSRLWAKAAFYQAGGATGYRDQLQDGMALVWAAPELLRAQIVLCASRQFEAGDVQHWWHAPGGAGVRTHFSDDLLWLPFACAHYLRGTGDLAVLEQRVPFLEGSAIPPGAEDAYEAPRASTVSASVYEHAARSLDHSLRVGRHGLPLMGGGDWNDGMNRVGHLGRGESVWLAWFLCAIVADWAPLARQRGDPARAARWEAARQGWQQALQGPAWDGQWYQRAFFDDGSPLGSHAQAEARIDLIAQAWSVLGDADAPEPWYTRQRQAMAAVETHLADPENGLLQLLAPPLALSSPGAGYIQAYPPGVRENGGQYTHAAVWALMASAVLARRQPGDIPAQDLPYRDFTWLSPAHRAGHPRWGTAYGLEPYAVAADVYSQPPYTGRGGWSWYTGAAGWLHRAAIESILGLRLQAQELHLTPCLPLHWTKAELTLRRGERRMRFVLVRGDAAQALAACGDPQARLLGVGESLRWTVLPRQSCFVVPL